MSTNHVACASLRDAEYPNGFPDLSLRHHKQTLVGSRLIRFTWTILWEVLMIGGCGFAEHPQFPTWIRHVRPHSIWAERMAKLFRQMAAVAYVSFDQCSVGAEAKKPTTLCLIRLPHLRASLLNCGHGGRCAHGPGAHEALQGRSDNGAFRTARCKVYPAPLNQLIADAITEFAEATPLQQDGPFTLPEEFVPLRVDEFEPCEVIQPDYHG